MVIPYFLISSLFCSILDDDSTKTTINSSQIETQKDKLIFNLIKQDKKDKITLMMKQGISKADAIKRVEALRPQYEIEKKKFYNYCKEDSEYCKSFISINEGIDSCGHIWRLIFDKPYSEKGAIEVAYFFDKDSLEFFNKYVEKEWKHFGYNLLISHIAQTLLDEEKYSESSRFLLNKYKKHYKPTKIKLY